MHRHYLAIDNYLVVFSYLILKDIRRDIRPIGVAWATL